VSIFHNFIKVEETQATHLCSLKPFIEDAVLKFSEFFFKKADSFTIKDHHLRVLLAVSEKCSQHIIDQVKNCLEKNRFLNMIPQAAEEFVAQVHLLKPVEIEASLSIWINKHVLLKSSKQQPLSIF
jgi:predicted nucleic acid-binding OB-fold protein